MERNNSGEIFMIRPCPLEESEEEKRFKEEQAINAMMLAYGSLHYADIPMSKTFAMSIGHLNDLYEMTGEEAYLHVALLHLRVFVRMGLQYDWHEALFNQVIERLGISKKEIFGEYVFSNRLIKLTRPQVRGMIGKWMPSKKNPQKIGEVVDEIIDKVKRQAQGIYTWEYHQRYRENIYELVILPEQCFFHDVGEKKYYFFDLSDVNTDGICARQSTQVSPEHK